MLTFNSRQAPHTHWLIDPSSTASSSGSVKSGPSMGSVHDIDNYDITGDGVKVNNRRQQ